MTVSSGFFNSVNHDRLYDAVQISEMFDGIIIDGVYENVGDAFAVTAQTDVNNAVVVGTGRAWFDHTWIKNDSQYSITLEPPNVGFARMDAIVLDIDRRTNARQNSIKYLVGSLAEVPTKPTLVKEELHNQYPICYITVNAGADTVISQSNITNMVGTEECPIVTGVLEAQNLDNLWQQLNSEFNTWWDGIKDTLDENTITNLQNQINEINEKLEESSGTGISQESIDFARTAQLSSPIRTFSVSTVDGTFLPDGYSFYLGWANGITSNGIVGFEEPSYERAALISLYNYDFVEVHQSVLVTKSDYETLNTPDVLSQSCRIIHVDADEYPCKIIIGACGDTITSKSSTSNSTTRKNPFITIYTVTITSEHVVTVSEVTSTTSAFEETTRSVKYTSDNSAVSVFQAYPQDNVICCSGIFAGAETTSDSAEILPFKISNTGELLGVGSKSAVCAHADNMRVFIGKNFTTNSSIYCSYVGNSTYSGDYVLFDVLTLSAKANSFTISNTFGTNYFGSIKIPNTSHTILSYDKSSIIKHFGGTIGNYEKVSLPLFIDARIDFSGDATVFPSNTIDLGVCDNDVNILYMVSKVDTKYYSLSSYISGSNGISMFAKSFTNVTVTGTSGGSHNASYLLRTLKLHYFDFANKKAVFLPISYSCAIAGTNDLGDNNSNSYLPFATGTSTSISKYIIEITW